MTVRLITSPLSARWPLPALLAWLMAWAAFGLVHGAVPRGAAAGFIAGALVGLAFAAGQTRLWRRLFVAAGFPLSAIALHGAPALPAWAWLAGAAALALAYPLRTWRDAPFFPTALHALDGLDQHLKLPPCPAILDAGCGAGHGLQALARVWPHARLAGVEWSRPLAWWAARRLPTAAVCRGDMWSADWSAYDLVYLFQRPESMARAWDKACREMRPGSWLVSLEFVVPGVEPLARHQHEGHRKAWIYRVVRRTAKAV